MKNRYLIIIFDLSFLLLFFIMDKDSGSAIYCDDDGTEYSFKKLYMHGSPGYEIEVREQKNNPSDKIAKAPFIYKLFLRPDRLDSAMLYFCKPRKMYLVAPTASMRDFGYKESIHPVEIFQRAVVDPVDGSFVRTDTFYIDTSQVLNDSRAFPDTIPPLFLKNFDARIVLYKKQISITDKNGKNSLVPLK